MEKEDIINNILERLNEFKRQSKIKFNPFDIDVEGDISEYKIVECINDEANRNKHISIGKFYEIESDDEFSYRLKNIRVWQSKSFFNEPLLIKVVCKGDYYELV